MILLRQNINNQVKVTLSEKKILETDNYLLQLTNDLSNEVFSLIVSDDSNSKLRYNSFCIPVTASANPYSGSINLTLPGFYHYTFYEMPSGSNTTSSLGLNAVENGKMLLVNNVSESAVMFSGSYNPAPVFNPEDYQ